MCLGLCVQNVSVVTSIVPWLHCTKSFELPLHWGLFTTCLIAGNAVSKYWHFHQSLQVWICVVLLVHKSIKDPPYTRGSALKARTAQICTHW